MMPKGKVLATPIDRVMSRIERITETGCWIFMGAVNDCGYGIVGKGGRGSGNDRAHRITYSHFTGQIPDGMFVCHHCDVPACCNPDHLFIGTNQDNVRDMRRKGRGSNPPRNSHVIGAAHPGSKLSELDVIDIRRRREAGETLQSIADRYAISNPYVLSIVRRQAWKHVA